MGDMTDYHGAVASCRHVAFKEVAGVAIGAVIASGIGAGIGRYRGCSIARSIEAGVGMGLFSLLVFAGSGNKIYDETIGKFGRGSVGVGKQDGHCVER